jgi:hypothetical protein
MQRTCDGLPFTGQGRPGDASRLHELRFFVAFIDSRVARRTAYFHARHELTAQRNATQHTASLRNNRLRCDIFFKTDFLQCVCATPSLTLPPTAIFSFYATGPPQSHSLFVFHLLVATHARTIVEQQHGFLNARTLKHPAQVSPDA